MIMTMNCCCYYGCWVDCFPYYSTESHTSTVSDLHINTDKQTTGCGSEASESVIFCQQENFCELASGSILVEECSFRDFAWACAGDYALTFLQAAMPWNHVWSNFELPAAPQLLNQSPPTPQQLSCPDLTRMPHWEHLLLFFSVDSVHAPTIMNWVRKIHLTKLMSQAYVGTFQCLRPTYGQNFRRQHLRSYWTKHRRESSNCVCQLCSCRTWSRYLRDSLE